MRSRLSYLLANKLSPVLSVGEADYQERYAELAHWGLFWHLT